MPGPLMEDESADQGEGFEQFFDDADDTQDDPYKSLGPHHAEVPVPLKSNDPFEAPWHDEVYNRYYAQNKIERTNENHSEESDFYVSENGAVIPAKYKDWLGINIRQQLMMSINNPELKKAINMIYRKGAIIGNGGTADVIRFELETGLLLSSSGHRKKGLEMIKFLNKIAAAEKLTESEKRIVLEIIDDLEDALGLK